ncbi:MAG: hypothetical protein M0024_14745 [Nitrospiraceae bacterium]|nr:hypothetical protein [Nitrospiraceae bacterium]
MKTLWGIFFVFILAVPQVAYAADKPAFQFTKQPELQQIRPKKPVKIRLKRTAKDEYSWEISGDDVDEIVRADHRLRKMLNTK